jgi:hypothetical protein
VSTSNECFPSSLSIDIVFPAFLTRPQPKSPLPRVCPGNAPQMAS